MLLIYLSFQRTAVHACPLPSPISCPPSCPHHNKYWAVASLESFYLPLLLLPILLCGASMATFCLRHNYSTDLSTSPSRRTSLTPSLSRLAPSCRHQRTNLPMLLLRHSPRMLEETGWTCAFVSLSLFLLFPHARSTFTLHIFCARSRFRHSWSPFRLWGHTS
jgi:hypothetical protein